MFLNSRFTINYSHEVSLKSIIEGSLEDIKDSISNIEFCTDEEIYAFLEENKTYTFIFERFSYSYICSVDTEITLNICEDRTASEEANYDINMIIKSITDAKNNTLMEATILYKS